jgi:hypothetical protein
MTKSKLSAAAPERLLYDVDETCLSLNIGRTTFYREVKAGELKTTPIGDRQFTTIEQRQAYIARKQQQVRQANAA